jgi:hypothetical protein
MMVLVMRDEPAVSAPSAAACSFANERVGSRIVVVIGVPFS